MADKAPRIVACVLATSIFLVSAPVTMAQGRPAEDRAPDLRDRIIRGELLIPYIKTRSVIDLPRGVDEAEYLLGSPQGEYVNIVQSDRQQVVRRTEDGIVVKVRRQKPRNIIIPYPVPDMTEYLDATPLINHDDAAIYEKAREIAEGETYAYAAAGKLHQWVYKNIRSRKNHAAPTSASQTLNRGSGDATEKAILLAALCRTLGIPARVVAGVEYQALGSTGIGSFEYHTWNEVYTGEWVPVDPSHAEIMADAAHIKLGHGNLSSHADESRMANFVYNLMDGLNVEVLRAQAAGSTEISLTGRRDDSAISIPKIDIASIDIQKQTGRDIRQFSVTEQDTVLSLKTPENLFTYGMEQLFAGDADKARDTFRQVSGKLSTAVEHYSLGEKLASLGLFSQARQEFDTAVRQDPSLKVSVNNWYREFFPKRNLSPETETAYAEAVNLAIRGSDLAEEKLQQLLGREPDFALPYLQLGQLYLSMSANDAAESAFRQFVQALPDDPRGYDGLGAVHMERGDYAKAHEQFKKAEILAGSWHTSQAQALRNEIAIHLKIAESRRQLARNPKNAHAWVIFGQALQEQGRLTDARKAFENALIHQPNNSEALLYQYRLHLEQSDWKEAEDLAEKVRPGSFQSAENRSLAYQLQGFRELRHREYDEALRSLESAAAVKPDNKESYLLMAELHRRQGHFDKAAQVLARGLKQVRHLEDKNLLRQALADRLIYRQPEEAKNLLRELVMDDPANPATYHKLGQIALASNDMAEARTRLFQAYLLNPYNPDILTDLGTLYLREDNLGDAVASYQKALKIDPTHTRAANRLTEVIEEYDFRIKKPEQFAKLNADEKDYLVNLMSIITRNSINKRDVLHRLNETLTSEHTAVNIQNIYDRHQSIPVVEDFYRLEAETYEQIKRIKPPGRFNQLHYSLAMQMYYETKEADRLRVAVPLIHTPTSVQEFNREFTEHFEQQKNYYALYEKEVLEITQSLDNDTLSMIQLESGLAVGEELSSVIADIARLRESVIKKLNPAGNKAGGAPNAAKKTEGAKTKGAGGKQRGWEDMSEAEKKKFIENIKNNQDVKSVTAE